MVSKRTRTVGSFVASATLAAGIVGATSLPGRNSVDAGDLRTGSVGASEIQTTGVGGKAAEQLGTRWALVAENGTIERQSGGFTIVNCYNANANCYLDAGEDVTNNGLHAQIVVANTDGSSILSAETGTAPCGAAFVACAPPPSPANAARFYVFVTGSEG